MQDITLETQTVLLRRLSIEEYGKLLALAEQDTNMWEFFTKNLSDAAQFKSWFDDAINGMLTGNNISFVIIDKLTNNLAGSSSLLNISHYDKRVEIGSSWLGAAFRHTGINKHAKYLLMRYVFENMMFERVEFKTGILNIRARKALQNIGAVEEGTLRSHMLLWNGQRRTSVYYSVLKDEWPLIKNSIFAGIK